jgi:hypothetical protein
MSLQTSASDRVCKAVIENAFSQEYWTKRYMSFERFKRVFKRVTFTEASLGAVLDISGFGYTIAEAIAALPLPELIKASLFVKIPEYIMYQYDLVLAYITLFRYPEMYDLGDLAGRVNPYSPN